MAFCFPREDTLINVINVKGETKMLVKNLEHTADRNPPSGFTSFKEFYTYRKSFWPSKCCCLGCSNAAEVGAHVKKAGTYDFRWYIVPLCRYHNNQFGQELEDVGSYLEPLYK